MKKFKKIIALGLTAVAAVSAMSISAFAVEENHDDAVVSFLAADGVSRIYLTQEDIDSGNNSVVGYDGIVFEVEEVSNNEMSLYRSATESYDFTINRTNVPISSYFSIESSSVLGSFNIAPLATKYSSSLFQNGSSTSVMLMVHPGMNLDKNVDFSLFLKGTPNRRIVTVTPGSTTTSITATNMNSYTLYVEAVNGLDTNAVGTIELSGAN